MFTYKNTTPNDFTITDLGLKFKPQGKRGDTVDLSKFASQETIENSADLRSAIQKKILIRIGSHSRPVTSSPSGRSTKKPNVPQMFVVYSKKGQKDGKTGKTAIAYNHTTRTTHELGIVAPVENKMVRQELIPAGTECVSKIPVDTELEEQVELETDPPEEETPSDTPKELAVKDIKMDHALCQNVNSSGKQCKKKPKGNATHCYFHQA